MNTLCLAAKFGRVTSTVRFGVKPVGIIGRFRSEAKSCCGNISRMHRRQFIIAASTGAIAQMLTPIALAQTSDFWSLPRSVWLYRPATREQVREVYFADGAMVWAGYTRLCELLRDTHENKVLQMSPSRRGLPWSLRRGTSMKYGRCWTLAIWRKPKFRGIASIW